jgi:hypothetical protein
MKDGHDENRSSIALGIHKSERLHPEMKKKKIYARSTMKDGQR